LYSILPDDPKEAAAIERKAPKFYYNAITRILYSRSHDGIVGSRSYTKCRIYNQINTTLNRKD